MRLAEMMERKKLNDVNLAKALGCAVSTVYQWRIGTYFPRADYLAPLCQVLNCSADELLGMERQQTSLSEIQGKRLYKAITQDGALDSYRLHAMANLVNSLAGKSTELELWVREMADALYNIEVVRAERKSLSHPLMQVS